MTESNVLAFPSAPKPLACPFCGGNDCDMHEDGEYDVCILCGDCGAQGPPTRIGCRDDDEGEIDLEAEAIELWNQRGVKL